MGLRLAQEVVNHYRGPDHKSRWLNAWALSANDHTREGGPGREVMAWRLQKSGSRTSNIATELIEEKVIEPAGGGGHNRGNAVYRLLPLAVPEGCPCFTCHPERKHQGSPKPNPENGPQSAPKPNPERNSQGSPRTNPIQDSQGSRNRSQGSRNRSQGSPATNHRVRGQVSDQPKLSREVTGEVQGEVQGANSARSPGGAAAARAISGDLAVAPAAELNPNGLSGGRSGEDEPEPLKVRSGEDEPSPLAAGFSGLADVLADDLAKRRQMKEENMSVEEAMKTAMASMRKRTAKAQEDRWAAGRAAEQRPPRRPEDPAMTAARAEVAGVSIPVPDPLDDDPALSNGHHPAPTGTGAP